MALRTVKAITLGPTVPITLANSKMTAKTVTACTISVTVIGTKVLFKMDGYTVTEVTFGPPAVFSLGSMFR